mmetsp:Transcript_28060/g.63231  ORF Transcript_28060/g.63231 Transcript_28060/m.63231 type:complete len:739 (+) Transcript_28060:103-2319(+)
MGTRLNAIREACRLPPDERNDDNINDVLEFVRDVKFFAKLTNLQQKTLCRTMSIESFDPRQNIFEVGDVGDKYYIILTGSVSVQVPVPSAPCPNGIHTARCDCKNRPLETTVFLAKGSGFGELALQSDQPRSATIFTGEKTEVLVITRSDYEKYAGKLHKLFIEQRVKFLRQCPLIEQALQQGLVSTADIASMANCLNERSLNGNQIVVRQGEPVESMIFVRSGSLAMLRLVDADAKESRRGLAGGGEKLKDGKRNGKGESGAAAKTKDIFDLDWEEQVQPASAAPVNLAKAMIQMKRQERDVALAAAYMQTKPKHNRRSSLREAAVFTEQLLGRRASFDPESIPLSPEEEQPAGKTRTDASESTTASGQEAPVVHKVSSHMWGRLKRATRQAAVLKGVAESLETPKGDPVSKLSTLKGDGKDRSAPKKAAPNYKLLRVGSVGAYQYFGDKEVCSNQVFPCSLMSDPIAEIYIMSKHDISRRLPKNLFSALFSQEMQKEPTDFHLLNMLRQNERWFTFRRSMHAEVLMCREQERGALFRATASDNRIDAAANFEFLGVNPNGAYAAKTLPPPRKALGVHLTPKDEELFSQTSARFLRRFEMMKKDKGLQRALRSVGASKGLLSSIRNQDAPDPMQIRFDQQWTKLQQDPVNLDLENLDDLFRIGSAGEGSNHDGELSRTLHPGRGETTDSGMWSAITGNELPPLPDGQASLQSTSLSSMDPRMSEERSRSKGFRVGFS